MLCMQTHMRRPASTAAPMLAASLVMYTWACASIYGFQTHTRHAVAELFVYAYASVYKRVYIHVCMFGAQLLSVSRVCEAWTYELCTILIQSLQCNTHTHTHAHAHVHTHTNIDHNISYMFAWHMHTMAST
jgi:hypothetical protein